MTATAMAGVIGGPVSGLLLKMSGVAGIAGWQWLFVVEGVPAIILGFVTLAYLPDGPKTARWLAADETDWIVARLHREREEARHQQHHTLGEALRSGRVWVLAFIYFAVIMSFYGISLWLPQIVQTFSQMSDFLVGVISAIPYVAASIGMVLVGRNSDRRGERRRHVAISAAAGAAGLVAAALFKSPSVELAALCLAAVGIWGTLGPFWAMSSEKLSGTAAAAGIALINSVGNLGGFLGPYLVGLVRKKTDSFSLALLALAIFPLIGAIVTMLGTRQETNEVLTSKVIAKSS
jgi:ACS family tartrate transporter-like MFS transporter